MKGKTKKKLIKKKLELTQVNVEGWTKRHLKKWLKKNYFELACQIYSLVVRLG